MEREIPIPLWLAMHWAPPRSGEILGTRSVRNEIFWMEGGRAVKVLPMFYTEAEAALYIREQLLDVDHWRTIVSPPAELLDELRIYALQGFEFIAGNICGIGGPVKRPVFRLQDVCEALAVAVDKPPAPVMVSGQEILLRPGMSGIIREWGTGSPDDEPPAYTRGAVPLTIVASSGDQEASRIASGEFQFIEYGVAVSETERFRVSFLFTSAERAIQFIQENGLRGWRPFTVDVAGLVSRLDAEYRRGIRGVAVDACGCQERAFRSRLVFTIEDITDALLAANGDASALSDVRAVPMNFRLPVSSVPLSPASEVRPSAN